MKLNRKKKKNNREFCEIFGNHAVNSAIINANRKHIKLYISKNKRSILNLMNLKSIPEIIELPNNEMNRFFGNETNHQGIVLHTSKLEQPNLEKIIDINKNKESDVIVILDQLTDPINVGSIMRSCVLFNCNSIIIPKDNAPEITASMAKAASGAIEIINYVTVVNLARTIQKLKKNK